MLNSLVWILMSIQGAWCLRMMDLHIPSRTVVGETIRLNCRFDLEGDPLYSIKWYRDDVEFFRYVPRDRPPGQYFPMEGIIVDQLQSLNNTVVLTDIDFTTSGVYKCEVSADAPSFQTEATKRKLVVKEFDDSSSTPLSSGPVLLFCLVTALVW